MRVRLLLTEKSHQDVANWLYYIEAIYVVRADVDHCAVVMRLLRRNARVVTVLSR